MIFMACNLYVCKALQSKRKIHMLCVGLLAGLHEIKFFMSEYYAPVLV